MQPWSVKLSTSAEDHLAVLAGIAGALDGDLHGPELVRIGGAPHVEGATAARPDDESPRRDELRMPRAVGRSRVPALIELPRR